MKPKALLSNPGRCHICGLTIPEDIVSSHHPLFGTVDHVIPLSKGGSKNWRNCAPAHRMCNRRKGSRGLSSLERRQLFFDVVAALKSAGIVLTQKRITACAKRAGIDLGGKPPDEKKAHQIGRWEDDGGRVWMATA